MDAHNKNTLSNKVGMQIQKFFTAKWPQYNYNDVNFVVREVNFLEDQGKVSIKRHVTAPDFWSQNAVDIIARVHLRRGGIPKHLKKIEEEGIPLWLQRSEYNPEFENIFTDESNVANLMDRMAGAWTYWGWKGGYFDSESDARAFYDECRYILIHQIACVNSPQLFNTGIHWAYGILGDPQGHYYFDPETKTAKLSTSAYERPQAHACFILSIADNLVQEDGIMDFAVRESRIFKFGSGSGANFSKLRAKGEKLSSGGSSSGVMSFLKFFDELGGMIKSGGSTRRAAKMVVLDENHPEINDFINWKVKEEDKVVSLITGSKIVHDWIKKIKAACEAPSIPEHDRFDFNKNIELQSVIIEGIKNHIPIGYISRIINLLRQNRSISDWAVFDDSYNSEAYLTVSGQNSNNSISITNDFMAKALSNEPIDLTARVNGATLRKVPRNELFDEICAAAWKCGDPALQFSTTMNERTTCVEKITATNPCSEFVYKDNNPCNLGSVNLCSFYNNTKNVNEIFDIQSYVHVCRLWTIVLEISIYMSHFPSKIIAENAYKCRTLGLGYTNLGGLLMRLCLPYDSQEGRAWAAYLAGVMNVVGYKTSAEMAKILGVFEQYVFDKEKMLKIIRNHVRAMKGEPAEGFEIQPVPLNRQLIPEAYLKFADSISDDLLELGGKYGFRNSQMTVIAPTGTIGLLMDVDTTSIEPGFSLLQYKKMCGGDYMKFVNRAVSCALARLGHSEAQIEEVVKYIVGSSDLIDAPHINSKSLSRLGIINEDIDTMNAQLSLVSNIEKVINYKNLSEGSLANLGLDSKNLPDIELLELLGFSKNEIVSANKYICGCQTIEGAPYIRAEHYPIFSCAVKCGQYGKQFIEPLAHVKMMAEVQTHISGAISKTVNLPEEASIEDFKDVYILAWKLGVKAIAIFRSGSKLSSALFSGTMNALDTLLAIGGKKSANNAQLPRGKREILPTTRSAFNIEGKINGQSIHLNIGFNKNQEVKEIFINTGGNEGSELRNIMSCFAKAVSIALQYGAPLEDLIQAFLGSKFEPSGVIKTNDFDGNEIRMSVSSPIDYIAQMLARFSKKTSSKNVNKVPNIDTEGLGYTGDYCANCGSSRMVRDGMCKRCEDCGTTTGCG